MDPELGFRCTVCRVRPGEPSSEDPTDPDLALCLECEDEIEQAVKARHPELTEYQIAPVHEFVTEWNRRIQLWQS